MLVIHILFEEIIRAFPIEYRFVNLIYYKLNIVMKVILTFFVINVVL